MSTLFPLKNLGAVMKFKCFFKSVARPFVSIWKFMFERRIDEQRLQEIKDHHLELMRKSTHYPRI